jgi:hypothetical protein
MGNLNMKYIHAIAFLVVMLTASVNAQETTNDDVIKTESKTDSTVTTNGSMTSILKSPPPSAISPTINTSNSDLCTFGVAGAVQTQILGISMGSQVTDENCEKLKNAKTLYDMGMKVAAVSVMCQDKRVFDAMWNAGTPCPKDGLIGEEAKLAWQLAEDSIPKEGEEKKEKTVDEETTTWLGAVGGILLLLLLL